MMTVNRLRWFIRRLMKRDAMKHDLDAELEATVELLIAEHVEAGMSRTDAERAARLQLGSISEVSENVRDAWVTAGFERFLRDIRYAFRGMRKHRGFAAAAVLTFGLAIGGITAIGSLVHELLIRPLPYPDSHELMSVLEASSASGARGSASSAANIEDWRTRNTAFEDIAYYEYLGFNISVDGGLPIPVGGLRTTHVLFDLLRATPLLGRTLVASDDSGGNGNVVVISYSLWRSQFNADSTIVGRTIRLNKTPFVVVGVMRPELAFPTKRQQVWVPISLSEDDRSRSSHSFLTVARLKAGITAQQARNEMKRIGDGMAVEFADTNEGITVNAFPLRDLWMGSIRNILFLLAGAVVLVTIMATVNVAGLMVARGQARQRELAARLALGGSHRRLVSQLITEGAVVGLLGGVLGVVIAFLIFPSLTRLQGLQISNIPFRDIEGVGINVMMLCVATAIAILTGAIAGAIPALSVLPRSAAMVLKGGGAHGSTARHGFGTRGILLSVEAAIAVIVLVGTGLLVNSLARAIDVSPGIEAQGVVALDLSLPQKDFYGVPERTTFCEQMRQAVVNLPGVKSVSAISHVPFSGADASRGFVIEGAPDPGNDAPWAHYGVACPGYFETMGIPIISGEDFSSRHVISSPQVVIVNQAFARRYFPRQEVVGKRIRFGSFADTAGAWVTIIGLVGDVRHAGLTEAPEPYFYRPYSQTVWPRMSIMVKSENALIPPVAAVRKALATVSPDDPVGTVQEMTDIVDSSVTYLRFPLVLMLAFGAIATALTIVGVFGVANQLVLQRQRELAIRSALGATARNIRRIVIQQVMLPVAAGITVGLLVARAGGSLVESMLYAVTPAHAMTFAVTGVALAAVAVLACVGPARRAARVDAMIAMRGD